MPECVHLRCSTVSGAIGVKYERFLQSGAEGIHLLAHLCGDLWLGSLADQYWETCRSAQGTISTFIHTFIPLSSCPSLWTSLHFFFFFSFFPPHSFSSVCVCVCECVCVCVCECECECVCVCVGGYRVGGWAKGTRLSTLTVSPK